jgi:putative effector of murein hydrolase
MTTQADEKAEKVPKFNALVQWCVNTISQVFVFALVALAYNLALSIGISNELFDPSFLPRSIGIALAVKITAALWKD